jgi:polyphenol oxidase
MRFKMGSTDDWSFYHARDLTDQGVAHGFFTSATPKVPLTAEEKRKFCHAFSVRDVVVMCQEHGDTVHIIREGEKPRAGDSLIVIEKGVAAIIKSADCLPIVVADPGYPMAAIIHAGWRGTAKKITEKTVRRMVELGGRPERMVALFGPSIGPCCYKVGSDVQEVYRDAGFPPSVFEDRDGAVVLNLKDANRLPLEEIGVPDIDDVSLCTYCTGNLFFSYRRGERNVRQLNFVSLVP